jgi:hypothetical protein
MKRNCFRANNKRRPGFCDNKFSFMQLIDGDLLEDWLETHKDKHSFAGFG